MNVGRGTIKKMLVTPHEQIIQVADDITSLRENRKKRFRHN